MSAKRIALVVNARSTLGLRAVLAFEGAGWQVLQAPEQDAGYTEEGSWRQLTNGIAPIDALVTCPPADTPGDDADAVIRTAWLGAKYALVLFGGRPNGTLLTIGHLPPANGAAPGSDAALESIRILTSAALLDAQKAGIALRSNRLFCAPDVDNVAFRETVLALCDDRSRFMAGAELQLPATPCPAGADARLDGKTVLVTGATSGIGRFAAIEIGRLGGWVAVGGRKLDLAEETLALVRQAGGDGTVISLDVTDADAWSAAARQIDAARGALHGMVNNAGEQRNRAISELTIDDLTFLLGINCHGVRLGIDAMTPLLAQEGGAVLNISSVAGIRAGPGSSAYGASKAAVIGLSRGFAARYLAANTPIRVNTLQPGLIWSDSVAESLGEEGAQRFRAMIEPKTPLGRVGTPEEIAAMIAFLLSDAALPITGQSITVSGGLELNFP